MAWKCTKCGSSENRWDDFLCQPCVERQDVFDKKIKKMSKLVKKISKDKIWTYETNQLIELIDSLYDIW